MYAEVGENLDSLLTDEILLEEREWQQMPNELLQAESQLFSSLWSDLMESVI